MRQERGNRHAIVDVPPPGPGTQGDNANGRTESGRGGRMVPRVRRGTRQVILSLYRPLKGAQN